MVSEVNLSINAQTAVYRVVKEALTNIIRHADANFVKLVIDIEDNNFILEVTDNGKGLSQKDLNQFHSFGILGMKERIQGINGTIVFNGIKNKGTTIKLKVPVGNRGI